MARWRETRGQDYVRTGLARAAGRGNISDAVDFASRAWGRNSVPAVTLRGIAGGLEPGSPGWGAELGQFQASAAELFELVVEASIPGKVGCRDVPLRVPLFAPDAGATAHWVAARGQKPVVDLNLRAMSFLDARKIAGIVVMSEDLLLSSKAEDLVRADMVRALGERLDVSFIDRSNAGVAGEEPTAASYGAPTVAALGDLKNDLQRLVAAFGGDVSRASFVAKPELFAGIAGADYPDVGLGDGSLLQRPAISSRNVPANPDQPETFDLYLVDGSGIALGAGAANIDATRHAALVLDEGEGPSLVDLWSRNLVGIRGEQVADWSVQREGAVAVLTGISPSGESWTSP